MTKQLIKGNYAIAQAAINAGCDGYFGYPITPQSEIGEYMSKKMQELERAYVCAESELAAINMVLGACSTGVKAMTSSSSCAIALMQEALSYIAADELPAVLVSVMRAGPGLGYIYPAQGDYNQATIGGGNGDYKIIVFAPSTVQECIDLTYKAFYLAQKYRNPVILLADGMLGQMMEPVEIGEYPYPEISKEDWALTGANNRASRAIYSLEPIEEKLLERIDKLFIKYNRGYRLYCSDVCRVNAHKEQIRITGKVLKDKRDKFEHANTERMCYAQGLRNKRMKAGIEHVPKVKLNINKEPDWIGYHQVLFNKLRRMGMN